MFARIEERAPRRVPSSRSDGRARRIEDRMSPVGSPMRKEIRSDRESAPSSRRAVFKTAENVDDQFRAELALNRQIDRPLILRHRVGTKQKIARLVVAPQTSRAALQTLARRASRAPSSGDNFFVVFRRSSVALGTSRYLNCASWGASKMRDPLDGPDRQPMFNSGYQSDGRPASQRLCRKPQHRRHVAR